MKFNASYDLTVKIITSLIFLLFAAIACYSVYDIISSSGDLFAVFTHLIVNIFQFGIVFLCYVYSPQYYMLNEDSLTIKRIAKDRIILLKEISEIRLLDAAELKGIIRTFGVGGLFGYFGKFASRKLGSMTWYTTQGKNRIVIIMKKGEKIVVTPDNIDLIEAVQLKISQ